MVTGIYLTYQDLHVHFLIKLYVDNEHPEGVNEKRKDCYHNGFLVVIYSDYSYFSCYKRSQACYDNDLDRKKVIHKNNLVSIEYSESKNFLNECFSKRPNRY